MGRTNATRSLGAAGIVALAGLVAFAACGDEEVMGGGGGGGGNISDPAGLEDAVRASFIPAAIGLIDGFERLITAINGGGSDGVSILPDGAGGFDASIQVDLDGNGSRESTVSGGFTDPLLTIDGVTDPDLPSASVSTSARVTQVSPVAVLLDQMSGTLSADPPGSGNAADVAITNGALSIDLSTGIPSGFVDCVISGEGETLIVETAFQTDGAGGFEVRFTGDGFDFTVP